MGTKSNTDATEVRPYHDTHIWLCFAFFAKNLSPDVIAQLGGVASRCRVLESVLLPPELSTELHRIYLAKGVHGTTAIEGNALSEKEVRSRIESAIPPLESKKYATQEVDNIIKACNLITSNLVDGTWSPRLSVERIKQFNSLVLHALPQRDERIVPGEIRTYDVGVFDYSAPKSRYCVELLETLCNWINSYFPFDDAKHPIANAIVKAIVCHVYIAWIHPFGDGNGRTARLLEFNLLIAAGVPSVAAHLLSNHYNQTRPNYLAELSQASKSGGDLGPFLGYAIQGLQDGLAEQFTQIETHQADTAWRDYVFSLFRNETGPTSKRRRLLALTLKADTPTARRNILELSPELVAMYVRKTPKTLSRDLKALEDMKLIGRQGTSYFAARSTLNAFKPLTRNRDA